MNITVSWIETNTMKEDESFTALSHLVNEIINIRSVAQVTVSLALRKCWCMREI